MDSYTDDVRMKPEGDVNPGLVIAGKAADKQIARAVGAITKPEGDVPTLVKWLAYHASIEPRCGEAADTIMSQATRIATLTEALERARGCIKGLCARTPVRDVAETLAEIDSALSAGQGKAK